MSKDDVVALVCQELGQILETPPNEVDINENFMRMGVSSIQAVKIINTIRKNLEIDISPAIIFEYQTIDALADYIVAGEF